MLRLREMNRGERALRCVTALLISLGLSWCALAALLPGLALWPTALLCLGCCLGAEALFSLEGRWRWLPPLALALALGLWGALGGGPVFRFVQLCKAAVLSFRGVQDALLPYAASLRLAVCLIFSLLGAALARDDTLPLAVLCVLGVVGLCLLMGAQVNLLLYALPAFAGLALLLARPARRGLAAAPVALALTALAFLLTPGKVPTVPALEKAAASLREFVEDYLLFQDYRASFSLTAEGYQPLDDRLGGPAEPEPHSVMEVQTGRAVLLRGKSYNHYTGLNWYDTLSAKRYLYASPRFSALREELFDLKRPLSENLPGAQTLRVHMLNGGTTTLFTPLHLRSLQMEGERMVLYYNSASELFLTRNLAAGDSYAVTYLPFVPGGAETEAAVAACAALEDPYYETAAGQYLSLPGHLQQELYDLAARVTANAQTPYEKALALESYLRANYRYTLTPQTPPDGVDFAAWFLLGEKEGYCTYFATAMTVLCRMAGVPARYTTGFLAQPDENGLALVTGEEAHAWTEVYLNGFGWLAFDATPRGDNDRQEDDTAPTPPPQDAPTPSPAPSQSPTEQPTEQPTEEPTEQPTEAPTDTPQDGPEESPSAPPAQTPTPAPGQTPQPSDTPADSPEQEQRGDENRAWLYVLLALLILALLALRYYVTLPIFRAKRHPERAARIYFEAICALLGQKKLRRQPQETLHDFAQRADGALAEAKLPPLSPLADALAGEVYGRHPADAAPFATAYALYRAAAPRPYRARLACRRMAGKY